MAAMTTTPRRAPATIPTTAPVEGPLLSELFELARAVPEASPVEVEVLPLTTITVVRVERGAVVSSVASEDEEETEVAMREVVERVDEELELELLVEVGAALVVVEEELVLVVVVVVGSSVVVVEVVVVEVCETKDGSILLGAEIPEVCRTYRSDLGERCRRRAGSSWRDGGRGSFER